MISGIPDTIPVYRFTDGSMIHRVLSSAFYAHKFGYATQSNLAYFLLESPAGVDLSRASTEVIPKYMQLFMYTDHRSQEREFRPYWRQFVDQAFPDLAEDADASFAFPVEIPDGIHAVLSSMNARERELTRLSSDREMPAHERKYLIYHHVKTMLDRAFQGQPELLRPTWSESFDNFHMWIAGVDKRTRDGAYRVMFDFEDDVSAANRWSLCTSDGPTVQRPTLALLWQAFEKKSLEGDRPLVETSKLDAWWETQYMPGEFMIDMESYLLLDAVLPVLFPTPELIVWLQASEHLG